MAKAKKNIKKKEVFLWDVYVVEAENPVRKWLGSTMAISAKQAKNNLRWRWWGKTPKDNLGFRLVVEKKGEMKRRAEAIVHREVGRESVQLFLPGILPSGRNAMSL